MMNKLHKKFKSSLPQSRFYDFFSIFHELFNIPLYDATCNSIIIVKYSFPGHNNQENVMLYGHWLFYTTWIYFKDYSIFFFYF